MPTSSNMPVQTVIFTNNKTNNNNNNISHNKLVVNRAKDKCMTNFGASCSSNVVNYNSFNNSHLSHNHHQMNYRGSGTANAATMRRGNTRGMSSKERYPPRQPNDSGGSNMNNYNQCYQQARDRSTSYRNTTHHGANRRNHVNNYFAPTQEGFVNVAPTANHHLAMQSSTNFPNNANIGGMPQTIMTDVNNVPQSTHNLMPMPPNLSAYNEYANASGEANCSFPGMGGFYMPPQMAPHPYCVIMPQPCLMPSQLPPPANQAASMSGIVPYPRSNYASEMDNTLREPATHNINHTNNNKV